MKRKKKLTVIEVAKIMGVDPNFVRAGLKNEKLPFGIAFKTKETNSKWQYLIIPNRFWKWWGNKNEEAEK